MGRSVRGSWSPSARCAKRDTDAPARLALHLVGGEALGAWVGIISWGPHRYTSLAISEKRYIQLTNQKFFGL